VADPRIERYASLLVERCVDVRPGSQVLVHSSPPARPLVEEVLRGVARRGAYALLRLTFGSAAPPETVWAEEAPEDLLAELPPIERTTWETIDSLIVIQAPENLREGASLSPERQALIRRSMHPFMPRLLGGEVRWVGCQYPTPALAQEAGMTLRQFEDFLYGSVLQDWEALAREMGRIAARFDAAGTVRVVGHETDVAFSLAGRRGEVDALGANMPGGEVYYSPVEGSAEGVVSFSEYPTQWGGREISGVRLRFEGGRVVEAAAAVNGEYLNQVLDTDEGARGLGEFGIGCNPGIQRHTKNTLFDEKIAGTVHFAVGAGFPFLGGTNESSVHWDMVKDLRRGGEILCDGEVVQRDGQWLI
jgi:aminopeptidase